jgi:hypothetical protein
MSNLNKSSSSFSKKPQPQLQPQHDGGNKKKVNKRK